MRINVAYAVSPKSRKSTRWHDGFTAAMTVISASHDVHWLNLHPDEPRSAESLGRLEDCDFLLAKSNWNWIVDRAVREHCKSRSVPKGLMISGVAPPPGGRVTRFYNVLYYETHWYRAQIETHPCTVHAFGIDTTVMRPEPAVPRDIDWLTVGQVAGYKRPERLLERTGRRVILGDLQNADPALVARLLDGGIELIDFVDYEMLAGYYRRAANVLVPCTIQGGGERSVLEGRACGAAVHVAEDNPKLLQLAALETVWDQHYYGRQLLDGMERASAPARRSLVSFLGL